MRALVAYSVRNPIVGNLLMVLLLLLGVISLNNMLREAFPEVTLDIIQTRVVFPGASPKEVEDGIVVPIEEAVQGVAGIDQVDSVASENMGSVVVTLSRGANAEQVLRDVQAKVDQIIGFPVDAETPIVSLALRTRPVISLMIYGDVDRLVLKEVAEKLRDGLLLRPGVSLVDVLGVRAREISVELSEEDMRRFSLGFDEVVGALRTSNLDLTSGSLRTPREELRVRTYGKRYDAAHIADVVLRADPDGRKVRLRDVAKVVERWEDAPNYAFFNGKPSVTLMVRKTESEDVLKIMEELRSFLEEARPSLPPGVELETYGDSSKILRDRMDLMIRNGTLGLVLVLVSLSLFLNLRLSFWVALGIPISFAGTFLAASAFDAITINVISLFGLILVSGILVDDAIVIGENIYAKVEKGMHPREAAVEGTLEVLPAVFASVVTTMIAFGPLFFLDGMMGKFIWQIAAMVVLALAMSLVESALILPAHLAHSLEHRDERHVVRSGSGLAAVGAAVRRFSLALRTALEQGFSWWVRTVYRPSVAVAVRIRWVTVALTFVFVAVSTAFLAGGHLGFVFFPAIDSDDVAARMILAAGTPETETIEVAGRIEGALEELAAELKAEDPQHRDIVLKTSTIVGSQGVGGTMLGSEVFEVSAELLPAEWGRLSSREVVKRWKQKVGRVAGVQSVYFGNARDRNFGKPIAASVLGADREQVQQVVARIKDELGTFPGVFGIEDDSPAGKREVQLDLTPLGRALGLTLRDIALQLRHGLYGYEALRLQRGRDEVKLFVRYPEDARAGVGALQDVRIRTGDGRELALGDVASWKLSDGTVWLKRMHRRPVITVSADVDEAVANAQVIVTDLRERVLPALRADFPGTDLSFEGAQKEQRKVADSAAAAVPIALLLIVTILILVFRSALQAALIMMLIPVGFGGMVISHLLYGMPLTVLSIFGMIALSGVVINDSVVFVDKINLNLREGMGVVEACIDGGMSRFRAIILTTLTTVAGLGPIIFETSLQAQFLIPMALTLAGGLAIGTVFTMVFLPAGFACINDMRRVVRWLRSGEWPTDREVEPAVREAALDVELGRRAAAA